MIKVSLTPAVFHLSPEVNSVAPKFSENPVVPRGPGLKPVLDRVRNKLALSLEADQDFEAVIFTSAGSGAIAAALSSFVDEKGILVVSNGAYGERQAKYAKQMGHNVVHYQLEYGVRPDLDQLETLIQQNDIGALGIVHGCTSTCNVNPIKEIGKLAKKYNLTYLVDGIASMYVEELNLSECNVDVLIGSTNKGLHSYPDLAFLLARKTLLEKCTKKPGKIPYFDIGEMWSAQKKGSHSYTINIRALLEVDQALDVFMKQGGILGRIRQYKERLNILRTGYQRLGLKIFEKEGMPLQNIGTAIYLPLGVKFDDLADLLANPEEGAKELYEIYSAQGKLSNEVFRIFNMGDYPIETYQRFIKAFEKAISKLQN